MQYLIFVTMGYAVVDIETTGGNPKIEKITEIAICIIEEGEITEEYSSLVNPQRSIPFRIQQLTGITHEMVATAPKFYEIARQVVETLKGHIFVAHNVNFDYGFIREEFKSLGYDFEAPRLCTVQLSRKIFPGLPSYGLGKLTKSLNIPLDNHHRAAQDAMATAKIFQLLLQHDTKGLTQTPMLRHGIPKVPIPEHLDSSVLYNIPDATGVYYLHDQNGRIIYIGKSTNIRKRIFQHLRNKRLALTKQLNTHLADITWEVTGSELVALLLESEEIKRHAPAFNQMQKRSSYTYGIHAELQVDGYIHLMVSRVRPSASALNVFSTEEEARGYLEHLIEKYSLCKKVCHLEPQKSGPCFRMQLHMCKGACIGKEAPEAYNNRVEQAIKASQYEHSNMLIIDAGREAHERAIIKIENGRYAGFGYADWELAGNDVSLLKDCTTPYKDNKEVKHLIKAYLNTKKAQGVIPY